MKKTSLYIILALLTLGLTTLSAQVGSGYGSGNGLGFVDENGDGINDLAPDADGDGIPNGMDEDFVAGDGTGRMFVDEDGDGFNDNARDDDGDGVPNGLDEDYVGGTGSGSAAKKMVRNQGAEMGSAPSYRNVRTPRAAAE